MRARPRRADQQQEGRVRPKKMMDFVRADAGVSALRAMTRPMCASAIAMTIIVGCLTA